MAGSEDRPAGAKTQKWLQRSVQLHHTSECTADQLQTNDHLCLGEHGRTLVAEVIGGRTCF